MPAPVLKSPGVTSFPVARVADQAGVRPARYPQPGKTLSRHAHSNRSGRITPGAGLTYRKCARSRWRAESYVTWPRVLMHLSNRLLQGRLRCASRHACGLFVFWLGVRTRRLRSDVDHSKPQLNFTRLSAALSSSPLLLQPPKFLVCTLRRRRGLCCRGTDTRAFMSPS